MCLMNLTLTQMREMVNRFNEQVTSEGKTEVVHEGDPDGTLFLINPDVSLCTVAPLNLYASTIFQSLFPTHLRGAVISQEIMHYYSSVL